MVQGLTGGNLLGSFVGTSLLAGVTNTFAGLFGGGSGTSGIQAAFQLLRDSPSPTALALRLQFIRSLQNRGNYPDDCRMVAIANGANNGVGLSTNGNNYTILRVTSPSLTAFLADRRAYAGPGIQIRLLGRDLGTRIVYSKISTTLLGSKVRFYPPDLQNWDVASGGTSFDDETLLLGLARTRPFTFAPTVSALGLNTNNSFYNIQTNIANFQQDVDNVAYTFNNNITEFDAIWADEDNSTHAFIEIADDNLLPEFVISEVSPDDLFIQDKYVVDGEFKIYEARNSVTLGRDETPAFATGNVVFEDGSTVIVRTLGEIILGDGYEPALGAEMDMQVGVFYDCQ